MKVFGERLKELRNEKGLSILQLGNELGVSDATICRWENDKSDVKAEQIVLVAQYFKVTTDYLLGLED